MNPNYTVVRWRSVAVWPVGVVEGDRSDDLHDTKEQASGVCALLKQNGFGGDGKVFPLQTYVEPVGPVVRPPFREVEGARPTDWDWNLFTADFDYLKEFYDVLLPDGTLHRHCWPNAGKMNVVLGEHKSFDQQDGIKVRLSPDLPEDQVVVPNATAVPSVEMSEQQIEQILAAQAVKLKGRTVIKATSERTKLVVFSVKNSCPKCQGRGYKGYCVPMEGGKPVNVKPEHREMVFCRCLRRMEFLVV